MNYQRRKEGATQDWQDTHLHPMEPGYEYRIKPEPVAPKWPQTTMVNRQINDAIANGPLELVSFGATETARRVINKAIEHECSTGALVPADKVRDIEAKAYEEGVKEGAERGLDKAIRATLNHVNFAVDGIGWMKIRSEAKK